MDAIENEYFSEEMYNIINSCLRNLNPKGVSFFSESRKGDDVFLPETMNVDKVELLQKSQSEGNELIFRVYIGSYYSWYGNWLCCFGNKFRDSGCF